MQVNYGETEIKELLQKVRIFNREIGQYEFFAITEQFQYVVKLSNGKLSINLEELQDDQNDHLSPERLEAIAKRFISNENPKKEEVSPTKAQIKPASTYTKKNKTNSSVIIFIVICVLVVIAAIVRSFTYNETIDDPYNSYEENVLSIEQVEGLNPENFLSADGTYRENFLGDKLKINCEVTNRATVVTYKDAVIQVTYYTKTKTVIGRENYVLYELFPPGSTKTVKMKIENYRDVNSIGWKVVGAKVY